MEPLFQLNVKDLDILLPTMKERLILQDEDTQISIVARVSNFFNGKSATERESLLSKLIKFDIVSTVLDVLQTPCGRLLPSILNFLSLISGYRKFYEDHVAMDAVDSMLKLAYCTSKSHAEETRLLERLILTITDILRRAVEFGVSLDVACVPQQILLLLKTIIIGTASECKLRLAATTLLNVVLQHCRLSEDCDELTVFHLCHESVNSMREIVEYSDDEITITQAAAALCSTCASCTRLCVTESDEDEGDRERTSQWKDAVIGNVYATVMNTIIPCVRNSEFSRTDSIGFHRDLVSCLNNLYKLRGCSHDDLSNHLTASGYLKYFLRLTVELPESLRRGTCMLISHILTTLAAKSLSIDRWPSGMKGFANLLYQGSLKLPRDSRSWTDIIAHDGTCRGLTLITLIYYDFHGTAEKDMISLESLVVRVMSLPPVSTSVAVQTLKTIWFLFAIAAVSHLSPNSVDDYGDAVKRLSAHLLQARLEDCYTHHVDLMRHCLKCAEVPKELRCRTMNLWLIESKGDVKPLLTLDCEKVVRHCLLIVVQTGYPEGLINLAVKGIRELMKAGNAKEISEIAWQMLPGLLPLCRPDKDERIKAILELANASVPHLLPLNAIKRCADGLVNIVLRRDADLTLKTLAIMQAYILLDSSVTRKSFIVLEAYIKNSSFMEILRFRGFSRENLELSAVCLKLLVFIIRCQSQFPIQCEKYLEIDLRSFSGLLLNAKSPLRTTESGTLLLLELLTSNTAGSAVRLEEITDGSLKRRDLVNLYETLHVIIHRKIDQAERDLIYQCLSAILKFSHRNVQTLMYHICTVMSNCDLVSAAFDSSQVSCHFVEFLVTWIRFRKRFCGDEGSWNPRSLCKTPFEGVLDRIRKHVGSLDNTSQDDVHCKLHYALSQFKEYLNETKESDMVMRDHRGFKNSG